MQPHIRWLIRSDLPAVVAIEQATYSEPWDEENFLHALRQKNVIGMVAEHGDIVVGFVFYELFQNSIDLLNLTVDPARLREGIGAAMLAKLAAKITVSHRKVLRVLVPESAVVAQLFLRECWCRCTEIRRKAFETEDGYLFEFRRDGSVAVPFNRIRAFA